MALTLILVCLLTAIMAGENTDNGENNIVVQTDKPQSDRIGDENLAAEDELPPHGTAQNTSRNVLIFLCALALLGAALAMRQSKPHR